MVSYDKQKKKNARDDAIYRDKLKGVQKEEKFKSMLYDKSIGGKGAYRPSDEFIEKHVGKPKDKLEQHNTAAKKADKEIKQQKAQARQKKKNEAANAKYQKQLKEHGVSESGQEQKKNQGKEQEQKKAAQQKMKQKMAQDRQKQQKPKI